MEIEHALFSSDTSLLVLKNESCEHTANELPTFSPQKRNLEIGSSERLLPAFGTKNRILKNGSCERDLRYPVRQKRESAKL